MESFAAMERVAIRLQAFARGLAVRRRVAQQHAAATAIQRHWRGYSARMAVRAVLQEDIAQLLQKLYDWAATRIQAMWRGYWVRQKVFCYNIYVTWKTRCLHRGHLLMEEMLKYRKLMEEEDRFRAKREAEKCSQVVLRKLHHLVSTKSTPGVFNSPRNPQAQAVEEGLRKLKFHSLNPRMGGSQSAPFFQSPGTSSGLAEQLRALDWEATCSRKLSVQRALELPETWKMRLRTLQSVEI